MALFGIGGLTIVVAWTIGWLGIASARVNVTPYVGVLTLVWLVSVLFLGGVL